ncbi:MAG: hypothetical protein R3C49_07195 [Planctomycetaceae bacterium]
MTRSILRSVACLMLLTAVGGVVFRSAVSSDESPGPGERVLQKSGRERLKALNCLIGEWRGVGQPKRGSREGAWTEKTRFVWDFRGKEPAVAGTAEGSPLFQGLVLTWNEDRQCVQLDVRQGDRTTQYTGRMPDPWTGSLQLTAGPDAAGETQWCTIRALSEIRITVLFETMPSAKSSFRRVAEIGYTRAGERLAVDGGNQRKCIVTGGLGTIPVTHQGKTYYVCCQGCVQAFNDAPAAIIADYEASLKTK